MVDWPGLLKWSLKYQDSTTDKKDIKPMDKETRDWLEEAIKSYSIDEVSEMKKIISELNKNLEKDLILDHLNNLFDLIENLDAANLFCKINGMPSILKIVFEENDPEIKILAMRILASAFQNNQEVQEFAMNLGALNLINIVLNDERNNVKEAAIGSLSALIRGCWLQAKRNFIDIDGIEFICEKILKNKNSSSRLKQRSIFLLKDLIFYDEQLDIEKSISNNESKGKCLHLNEKGIEEEKGNENQEIVNSKFLKYKNIVKKKINEYDTLEIFGNLIQDCSIMNYETRISVFQILKNLFLFNKIDCLEKWRELLNNHLIAIKVENEKNDNYFQTEIDQIIGLLNDFK